MYRTFYPTGFVATIATTLIRITAERGQFSDAEALLREFEPLAAEGRRYRLPLALAEQQLATGRIAEGVGTCAGRVTWPRPPAAPSSMPRSSRGATSSTSSRDAECYARRDGPR